MGGLGLGLGLVRLGMYDISLSYMMYLPVPHSIPLTIILRSVFCILRSAKYPCQDFTLKSKHQHLKLFRMTNKTGQYKMQTADCRLQTGYKMQTRYKMQTADCRLGTKCRLTFETVFFFFCYYYFIL